LKNQDATGGAGHPKNAEWSASPELQMKGRNAMPHKRMLGIMILSLLLAGSCLAGVLRTDETFEITLPSGESYKVKVKFGLGYTSEKKVNSVDFTVENLSKSGEISVTRGRLIRTNDHATLRGENYKLAIPVGDKVDKQKILNREKLEEHYWQVVTEISVEFNGVTKFFVFTTTKGSKEITMRDRPF
jgi:hypothetical protein